MSVSGFVYYCPDLQFYRYHIKDSNLPPNENEEDMKFTEAELEDSIAAQLVEENEESVAHARFVAGMTGLGRVNPHKVVVFDTDNDNITILEPKEFWEQQEEARKNREAQGGQEP